mgnify:CR=1 FL=1
MLFAILNTQYIHYLKPFNLALDFEKNYNFRSFAAVEAAIQSTSNGCVIASAAPVCDHHQSMIQAGTLRIDAVSGDGDNCNINDAATAKHDNDHEDDDDYCNRNDDDNTDDDLVDDDYDGT